MQSKNVLKFLNSHVRFKSMEGLTRVSGYGVSSELGGEMC